MFHLQISTRNAGGITKTYYAKKMGLDPKDIFLFQLCLVLSKFESVRPELAEEHVQDVDAVLTTRDL